MQKFIKALVFFAALCVCGIFAPTQAQSNNPQLLSYASYTVTFRGAPSGICYVYQQAYDTLTGNIYSCGINGDWVLLSGGGGSGVDILPLNNSFTGTNAFSQLVSANGGINLPPIGASLGDVALQVFPNDGVLYVSPSGSDSNNGKSAGAAMATWYHAACSLPGGNCATQTAGGGTIYMYPGSEWNSTSTCGAWLMGSQDPNYATPPMCWLKQLGSSRALTTIGIPATGYGPNGQMGVAGITGGGNHSQPGIWLSGTVTTVFKNIAVGVNGSAIQRGIVVGECSNGTRTNLCNSSAFVFDNVNADATGAAGTGPSIDLTGGSFWGKLLHVRAQGNDVVNSPTSNAAAGILLDGTGNSGLGLIQLFDINTAEGGVKIIPGTSFADFHIEDLTTEGQNAEPAVEIAAGGGGAVRGEVVGVQVADSVGDVPAVENDADGGRSLHVSYSYSSSAPALRGAMQVGGEVGGGNTSVQSQSFLSEGQVGFANGWDIAKRDDVQRAGDLTPVRVTNAAVSSACSGWKTASLTLTCGQADVYGGTAAGVSSAESAGSSIRFTSGSSGVENVTLSVGETIIGGFFSRSTTANGYAGSAYSPAFMMVQGTGFAISGGCDGDSVLGDGQWTWNRCLYKVTTVGTNPASFEFGASADSTHHVQVFAPVLNFIAAGTISTDEAYAYYNALRPYDTSCVVGTVCGLSSESANFLGGLTAGGTIDFHNAAHTLPDVSGQVANLPTSCTTGEQYFATDAAAGANLYGCTSPNAWTQLSGGGGGSMTWPVGGAGIPNYSGSSSWGTSYSATNQIPANFVSPAALTTGHIFVGSGSNIAADVSLTGDCSLINTGAITCSSSNGIAFGTAAFANKQGSDTNVLSAGTVSGTAALLCTDANGGATTVSCPSGAVSSVFGRTGAVVAAANDYNFNQLAGTLAVGQTPLTTSQDILFDNAGNLGRLPITTVTSGQCLGNNAGVWGTFICAGSSGLSGQTPHGVTIAATATTSTSSTSVPTTNGQYSVGYNVTGGVAVDPTVTQLGLSPRTLSASDTIAYSDVASEEDMAASASANVALSLPTPTTLGNTGFFTRLINRQAISGHSIVVTPAAGETLNGGTGAVNVPPQETGFLSIDPTISTNWSLTFTPASPSGVSSMVQSLTGCNTTGNVYTPQANDCVAPSGGGGGLTTASSTEGPLSFDGAGTLTGTPTSGTQFLYTAPSGDGVLLESQGAGNATLWAAGSGDVIVQAASSAKHFRMLSGAVHSFSVVTFSATPTFNAGQFDSFEITLAGNVTSSSVTNALTGEQISFIICQDATGGRTFSWPLNFKGAFTGGLTTANTCASQSFLYDGTNWFAKGSGLSGE